MPDWFWSTNVRTLISWWLSFFFSMKKSQVQISEPRCTCSDFVLSVRYQYSVFEQLKKRPSLWKWEPGRMAHFCFGVIKKNTAILRIIDVRYHHSTVFSTTLLLENRWNYDNGRQLFWDWQYMYWEGNVHNKNTQQKKNRLTVTVTVTVTVTSEFICIMASDTTSVRS